MQIISRIKKASETFKGKKAADKNADKDEAAVASSEAAASAACYAAAAPSTGAATGAGAAAATGTGTAAGTAGAADPEASPGNSRHAGSFDIVDLNITSVSSRYCDDSEATARSLFDDDGTFLFDNSYVEVPPEQYDQIISSLKEKIKLGKVKTSSGKTIKNPDTILQNIKKGGLSYKQVRNIARAGNIDSLKFDIKTNAVSCSCSLGVSFAIGMALSIWGGQNIRQAFVTNLRSSLNSSLSSMLISVATAQVLRTSVSAVGAGATTSVVGNLYGSSVGHRVIDSLASYSAGTALSSAGAVAQVSSLLRTNVISGAVTAAILTAPDFYRAIFAKSISWQQLTKNMALNIASIAGGTGGWLVCAAIGASAGSVIPGAGTAVGGLVGGIAGAFAGSTVATRIARKGLDKIRPDDAQLMIDICQKAAVKLCVDYMLSEDEAALLIEAMQKQINRKWLMSLYASGSNDDERLQWCYSDLEQHAFDIACKRQHLTTPDNDELAELTADLYRNLNVLPMHLAAPAQASDHSGQ